MIVGVSMTSDRFDSLHLTYCPTSGERVGTSLGRVAVAELVAAGPVRQFRWYKGRTFYSGWYWSSTTGGLVVYESRLELARILLADFDPDVRGIVAQPFLMRGRVGSRERSHVPDLLLSHAESAACPPAVGGPAGDDRSVLMPSDRFDSLQLACRTSG